MNEFLTSAKGLQSPWIGLDIGGANIKAAHANGWSCSCVFPMWKQWKTLSQALANLLQDAPAFSGVGLTMTGELADCFATRAEGVAIILEQLTSVLPASMVRVYDCTGRWKSVSQAAREPWAVAASNWHALASFIASRRPEEPSLLIDIGSTTTDIIPIRERKIAINDRTDSQRLQSGALVYTGVERSNIASIVQELPLFGKPCGVMNEQFATTLDVYLWLGKIPEDVQRTDTADGRPATREQARYRLARLVGEDGSTLADSDVDEIANATFRAQASMVASGIMKVSQYAEDRQANRKEKKVRNESQTIVTRGQHIVLSGHGDFLLEGALEALSWKPKCTRLQFMLGESLSRCSPAYAIAVLASEEL